jgi:hypothetical protein
LTPIWHQNFIAIFTFLSCVSFGSFFTEVTFHQIWAVIKIVIFPAAKFIILSLSLSLSGWCLFKWTFVNLVRLSFYSVLCLYFFYRHIRSLYFSCFIP